MKDVTPILLAIIVLTHSVSAAERVQLYPIDEAFQNPSFVVFRDSLISAIEKEDLKFILECVDVDIVFYYYDKIKYMQFLEAQEELSSSENHDPMLVAKKEMRGKDEFERWCFIERNGPFIAHSPYDKMLEVLNLGGSFVDSSKSIFRAPYTWSEWPDNVDYYFAVISDSVVMFNSDGIIDTLSYDLVYNAWTGMKADGAPAYFPIRTYDGKVGKVLYDTLRSRNNFGMEIQYIRKRWRITKFTIYP